MSRRNRMGQRLDRLQPSNLGQICGRLGLQADDQHPQCEIPVLIGHDAGKSIGVVVSAKVTRDGVEVVYRRKGRFIAYKNGDGRRIGPRQQQVLDAIDRAGQPISSVALALQLQMSVADVCWSLRGLLERRIIERQGTRRSFTYRRAAH